MIDKKDVGLITQDYRLAKNKEEQITIMSQLYGTDTADIRGILFRAGVYKLGNAEIRKALEILSKDGKNHTLGGLRLWLACFKDCSSKNARRILIDYMKRPWDGAIPVEEFKKALKLEEITVKKETDMAAAATPKEEKKEQPAKTGERVISHALSDEERKMIIYGLTGMFSEKDEDLRKLKKDSEYKLQQLEKAQREYQEAKEKENRVANAMADLEQLINRINGDADQKVMTTGEHLWDIMASE